MCELMGRTWPYLLALTKQGLVCAWIGLLRRSVRVGEASYFGARVLVFLKGGRVAGFVSVVHKLFHCPPHVEWSRVVGVGHPLVIVWIGEAFEQVPEWDHSGKRCSPKTMHQHQPISVNCWPHLAIIWERSNLVMNSVGRNDSWEESVNIVFILDKMSELSGAPSGVEEAGERTWLPTVMLSSTVCVKRKGKEMPSVAFMFRPHSCLWPESQAGLGTICQR